MKLSFELTEKDLRYFRTALNKSRNAVRYADESEIIDAIRDVLRDIQANEPLPDFVAGRIPVIEMLIEMLVDAEWKLPRSDRERLLAVFMYFGDPEDILPDEIPVIGYLDDVIIVELVIRDLKHVLKAYEDFCRFRKDFDAEHDKSIDGAIRRDRIDRRRQQLHQRMRRRSSRQTKTAVF